MARKATTTSYLLLGGLLAVVGVQPFVSEARGDRTDIRAMKRKMSGWARELGVKCDYCHVPQGREFDYEAATPKKEIAAHCDEHFVQKLQEGGRAITCLTCHQRRPRFFPRPPGEEGPPAPDLAGEGEPEEGGEGD